MSVCEETSITVSSTVLYVSWSVPKRLNPKLPENERTIPSHDPCLARTSGLANDFHSQRARDRTDR
jgi:hypothetical protein